MQWTYVEPYTQQLENTHSTQVQHELQNRMQAIPQSKSQLIPKNQYHTEFFCENKAYKLEI